VQKYNNKLIEESSTSMDGLIIQCYLDQMSYNQDGTVTAQDIRNDMINIHSYKDTLNVRTVGKHLRILGFESISKKVLDKTKRVIVIDPERIKHLIFRYVPLEKQDKFLELVTKEKPQKKLDKDGDANE